jgi:hypothetical protein
MAKRKPGATSKRILQKATKAKQQKRFLDEYRKCGNIVLSAKRSKVGPTKHYDWLDDAEYESQFAVAQEEAVQHLEAEVYRRGVEGVNEPVWYQGQRCGVVRKYSDTLLIFLLKGTQPEKYAQFINTNIQGKVTLSRGPDLAQLSDEQFSILKQLAGYQSQGVTALAGPSIDISGGAEAQP